MSEVIKDFFGFLTASFGIASVAIFFLHSTGQRFLKERYPKSYVALGLLGAFLLPFVLAAFPGFLDGDRYGIRLRAGFAASAAATFLYEFGVKWLVRKITGHRKGGGPGDGSGMFPPPTAPA
jgi:hypothetical protein